MRRLHALFGLVAGTLLSFMALTGAVLSLQPALEAATAGGGGAVASVADLASKVAAELPGVERLTRSANGMIVAYFRSGAGQLADQIDPGTGAVMGPYAPSALFSFVTELHRSLFLGDAGRIASAVASAAFVALAISGIVLLVARMGGWRRLTGRVKGDAAQRLHARLARLAVLVLVVTALSGLYMSAYYFGLVPDGSGGGFALSPVGSGGAPAPVGSLTALVDTPGSALRELVFPAAGKAKAVFTLTTGAGVGYVDQATGAVLKFTANNFWQRVYETIYLLHTGEGAWWYGLLLGLAALAVPALAVTGTVIWAGRRAGAAPIRNNAGWGTADTVILYGTEGGTTSGFAAALHAALVAAGHKVHTGPMNALRAAPRARRMIILSATYGDGHAPRTANRFLARLSRLQGALPACAVLGFGDRSFAHYAAFAAVVEAALRERGAETLLPFATVDRQSEQAFLAWSRRLGDAVGSPLAVDYRPARPRTARLVLASREDFGIEVQAPTAILRFTAGPDKAGWLTRLVGPRLPRFAPGDLVGIIPPGSTVPRYYSLATGSADGELEICVRKQANGLCSEYLHGLRPGDATDAFVRTNPDFRPRSGRKPLVLVGAGTGIAPLAGFVRHNRRRPTYVFFGARDPDFDFLYRRELEAARAENRLNRLETAFSRVVGGGYVQDRVAANAELLRRLVEDGADIFVCGGLEMARGVRDAFDQVLAPLALSVPALKSQGRYFEDAY